MKSRADRSQMPNSAIIGWSLIAILGATSIIGGGEFKNNLLFLMTILAGIILLGIIIACDGLRRFQELPFPVRLLAALIATAPLLQLIPMPAAIWQNLPGRETQFMSLSLINAQNQWQPLTLTPMDTASNFLYMISPAAIFLAVLNINHIFQRNLMIALVALASLSLILGILQITLKSTALEFYVSEHNGFLLGFFSNRNHSALYLIIFINCTFALTVNEKINKPPFILIALTFLAIVGAITTASRSGSAIVIINGIVILMACRPRNQQTFRITIITIFGFLISGFLIYFLNVFSRLDMILGRYSKVTEDPRWEIYSKSLPLVHKYFPVGSGFGSFVQTYAIDEPLQSVRHEYVNHVHNEYIEWLIEGGILSAGLIAGSFALLILAIAKIMRSAPKQSRSYGIAGAALVSGVLAQSILDYPARRMAIASVLAIGTAMMLSVAYLQNRRHKNVASRPID